MNVYNYGQLTYVMLFYIYIQLVLKAPTSGIIESNIEVFGGHQIQIVDTGGIRNERRKWPMAFNNVTCIFFCVSLSEFDETLLEDDNLNRISESLSVFEEIANHKDFKDGRAKLVLIFTHKDRFIRKLLKTDLKPAFPNLPKHLRYSMSEGRPMTVETFSPVKTSSFMRKYDHMFSKSETPQQRGSFNILLEDNYRDILNYICFFLNARQLVKLSYVNYKFYVVSGSDIVWRELCSKFQPEIDHNEVMQLYMKRYLEPLGVVDAPTTTTTTNRTPIIFDSHYYDDKEEEELNKNTVVEQAPLHNDQKANNNNKNNRTITITRRNGFRRSFGKHMYKFYFELGGGTLLHNIKFVIDQFLKRIGNEEMREETRNSGVIVTNCLDVAYTRNRIDAVLSHIISSQQRFSNERTQRRSPR